MKKMLIIFLSCLIMLASGRVSMAKGEVRIQPNNSDIEGSIKYSVIGKYKADFDEYAGIIIFDERRNIIKSVELSIKAASLCSRFPRLDRLIRSERLLNVGQFPDITFKSEVITKTVEGYKVMGTLDLHGIREEFIFPFDARIRIDAQTGKKHLVAEGRWVIKRKDFGIIWNKVLDKGGIIVGNHITVDWRIETPVSPL